MTALYCNQCQSYVDTNEGELIFCPMCHSELVEPLPVAETVASEVSSSENSIPVAPPRTSGMVMPGSSQSQASRRRHGWTILHVAICGLLGNLLVVGPFLLFLDPATIMDRNPANDDSAFVYMTMLAFILSGIGTLSSLINYVAVLCKDSDTGTRSIFVWMEEVGILLLYSILNLFLLHILVSAAIVALGPTRLAVGLGFLADLCVMLLLVRRFFILAKK